MFTINSNPSGYDTKYCGSYLSTDSSHIENEYKLIKTELATRFNQQNNINAINNTEEQSVQIRAEQCDSISQLKINYILEVIRRKLNILHRITKYRVLKKKIPDSQLIEREIEKRATLSIVDMLKLLQIANKDNSMTTQQRVALLSEINKKAKLTVDEKIIIVKRLIALEIILDTPSKKHMANKLTLLYIVKKTGFSIDVTRVKGYKPVMQSVEENPLPSEDNSDSNSDNNAQISEKQQEEALHAELTEDDISETSTKATADSLQENENTETDTINDSTKSELSSENKASIKKPTSTTKDTLTDKKKSFAKKKKIAKVPAITRTFVNSKRHFKFGAGYVAKNEAVSLLLPSGYLLDSNNKAYQANRLRSDNIATGNNLNYTGSPLSIVFVKNDKSSQYSLLDFFNSNIIQCKENNLKYRQTVVSNSPAVLKHKSGDNIYTASVFIKKKNCVYDIQFTFKKTVANTASTVNRILASIQFEGM